MAVIESINLRIVTGNVSGAGTDGAVYLGICGREFRIDSSGDDFKRGAIDIFRLGSNSNIKNEERNDPRNPKLRTEDLDKFPVYIRLEPKGDAPDWNLKFVGVQAGFEFGANFTRGLWLGRRFGKVCYLREGRFSE